METIAIIGLGYVGLPLAVEFGKNRRVIGYDVDEFRIKQLQGGYDETLELTARDISNSKKLLFTSKPERLKEAQIFIVTVPTPIDRSNRPDLKCLLQASEDIGKVLKKGDIVVYESTVYPGATEEECVPILELHSGLKFNEDFYCGYSPERINPGDKIHRLTNIIKITSGSTKEVATKVDDLYSSIVVSGTYKASSIKVAEAAKVIENTQRDLNVALMNELAIIFNKLDIDTEEVLKAAGTKWNFLPFRPGLVGGHCIGVDPYYLTHKAEQVGYHPEVILSGRRINDGMSNYVASQLVKCMIQKEINLQNARILVMGLTFKENCPDTRNSRVFNLVKELDQYGFDVTIYDPWISPENRGRYEDLKFVSFPEEQTYDAILISVAHTEFINLGGNRIRSFGAKKHVLYDLKYILPVNESDVRL